MNYLLHTNVVSEWVKLRPNAGVVAWLAEADEDRMFLSVVTLAELRHGTERMAKGQRRNSLEIWLQAELPLRFEGRILAIDQQVANAWGRIAARRMAIGRPISVMDAFIAATAEVHNLTLVTHNTSDFASIVKGLINPWTRES